MAIFHEYPYTDLHDLNLDWILKTVKELKEKVDQLDLDTIIKRLNDLSTAVSSLQSEDEHINDLISAITDQIESVLDRLNRDESELSEVMSTLDELDNLVDTLNTTVINLAGDVRTLDGTVGALQSQVTSNTGRIEALEDATLNAPTEGNENLIIGQFQNLNNLDYEIVEVTNNGSDTNNIQVADGLIRMLPQADYNEMALVIKNVLPVLVGTYTSSMILSFGLKYKTSASNNGTDYCVNVPITSLTGSTPYIANSGYTSTRASLRVLQLKVGSDEHSYDLWIYNRYQGQYPILPGSNINILALAMVFRGFDSSFTTSSIKAYFSTVYGNAARQVKGILDKNKSTIISTSVREANGYTNIKTAETFNASKEYSDSVIFNANKDSIIRQTSGLVNFNPIDPSVINPDITVTDYSRYGVKSYQGQTEPFETPYHNEFDIFIDIEVTITGSGAVNTSNSIPVLNITNTKGAVIPHIMPLYIHTALPSKKPFSEAYLHTNGNVIFRTWFDDTVWDYNTNPVTVRISGFIPLVYSVNT